jgi:hypothetical protein
VTDHPPSTDRFSDFNVFEQQIPPFSFGAAFSVGWQSLKRNYWLLFAVSITCLGIGAIPVLLQVFLNDVLWPEEVSTVLGGREFTYPPGKLLEILAYIFLTPIITAGFEYTGLGAVRCQTPGIGTLFAGFSRYWLLVRAQLIMLLIWVGPLVLIGVGVGAGALIGSQADGWVEGASIGLLVMVLPALIILIWQFVRLSYTYLLIMDPMSDVSSAWDAVCGSWNTTRRYAWRLVLIWIVIQVGMTISLCCFLLPGFFLAVPLSCAIMPATYEMIRRSVFCEEMQE